MGLDKRQKWVVANEKQRLKLWNYYFLFATEFIWTKLSRSTSSSMISRQFWEKGRRLLTWYNTGFGGGIHDFKITYIKVLEMWNTGEGTETETRKMNKKVENWNISWLTKSTQLLDWGREKPHLSLTIYKRYSLGYFTVITPLGHNILISILPEGLGMDRSPRSCPHMANKILSSDEEILLKKKQPKTSILPPSSAPINFGRGKTKTLIFIHRKQVYVLEKKHNPLHNAFGKP